MFERYTERARRVLFFARYEAAQLGARAIETEHLLLGLVRDGKGVTGGIFAQTGVSLEDIRSDLERRVAPAARTELSEEIPFSAEVRRVLIGAAEDADALRRAHIDTEHLLLALLREERCPAAAILRERGLSLPT